MSLNASDRHIYPVPTDFAARAHINRERYETMYRQSVEQPDTFWAAQARKFLTFERLWDTVVEYDLKKGDAQSLSSAKWFAGSLLNVSANCIDRHLATRGEQTAIIWEGDDPSQDKRITYRELHKQVCQLANALKVRGVKRGDRVCIYMPMIPEAAYAMLACTRIGAVHSIVFGGFSPEALKDRILDSDCRVVITADEGLRGGKSVPLKANVDSAVQQCKNVHTVLTVKRTGGAVAWNAPRDIWYHEFVDDQDEQCDPEWMGAEDPLFILYTSGSTGKPKGVLHTTAGYLLMAAMTHKYTFDYHDGDIFWCTADVGWVTGHSYTVYGPLANGGTTLMFEGVPTYPDASRCWQVCDKHQVNIFYTAPTALRALMAQGNDFVSSTSRASIRLLGTVGEPINPEAWEWYHRVVGESRCPIVDTWWQTETGGVMISPLPGIIPTKPSFATLPLPGIQPIIVNAEGTELHGNSVKGNLCIKFPWPGIARTIWGDHERFRQTYFSSFKNLYFTGDGVQRDEDGYYRILGRVDDVINVSGHRLGTAEIENAINAHPLVNESAVVGYPHPIKGQGIYAFVVCGELSTGGEEGIRKSIKMAVTNMIGPFARPDLIQLVPGLPKTRSGKIMRRILRKVAEGDATNLGDITTLLDEDVVTKIIDGALVEVKR